MKRLVFRPSPLTWAMIIFVVVIGALGLYSLYR